YVLLGVAILIVLFILYRISRLTKSVARWRGLTLANETILMHLGWRKGLHQLSFKIDSPAKNIKVVAKKGRTRHAKYTHPKDFVYRYFRVTSSVQNVDIKESKFRFRVSRQWMKRRGIKPEDISLAMLKYTGYTKLKAIREGSDKNYVYYKANAEGFGQFAIVGKTSAKERYKSRWIAILALIILAVLAGGITAVLTADQPIQVKGIPQQMWDQDLQHSLDLSKYFNDPDGDELNFTFNELDTIDVWVDSEVAYFMPDYKWSGQRTIIFTATDGKGGEISSNPVKLIVKKTIFPKEYIGYLKYVLIGVIILILLLAVLIFRKPVMKWLNEE
ncbi:PGF-pre-PGF domain-containing protein, partial [Candidatus Woesearchaeota archaeon]|nr:PGF-pre-PGF domain-containing protein [Candidatus Woesearchaeota archaeon]